MPRTLNDAKRLHTVIKNSIIKSTPRPKVFIKYGHACVTVKDILGLFLAHGFERDKSFNFVGPKQKVKIENKSTELSYSFIGKKVCITNCSF